VSADRRLASWLLAHRLSIESAMNARLGVAAPAASAPESEALRRFRSFLCSALVRGDATSPALDGLRLGERRVMALIDAWIAAAEQVHTTERSEAERELAGVGAAARPWAEKFRLALRTNGGARMQKTPTRVARRAVAGAIDRVADAFLAIDTDTAEIVDANPAAGSLLGVSRDALLGVDALSFVPPDRRASWRSELDAVTEDDATRSFAACLHDTLGSAVDVDATMTRFATRGRVLALLMVRPTRLHAGS
jgi:PAS domain-containing protein